MAGAGVIDDYVADLDGRLRGAPRAKLDLLTEARDHLEDAVACYRDAGFREDEAQRKAVADFGPAPVIARGYQAELAAAYGARTLRSILFVLPVVHLIWDSTRLWWAGPGQDAPTWYYLFAQVNDSMVWAVAVAAGLALLVGRLMARRVADSRLMAKCSAGVAYVVVGACGLALLGLVAATAVFDSSRLLSSPMCLLASAVAVLVMVRLGVMARRTTLFCA
jgi:hypothetical protein